MRGEHERTRGNKPHSGMSRLWDTGGACCGTSRNDGNLRYRGTTASGWLTDRLSSRYLLFAYYSLRGVSLMFLPHTLETGGSHVNCFAVFYGLDWIATVPPTVRLTTNAFGRENTGFVYGWIGAAHQLGASLAALIAGPSERVWEIIDHRSGVLGPSCFLTSFVFLCFRDAIVERPKAVMAVAPVTSG